MPQYGDGINDPPTEGLLSSRQAPLRSTIKDKYWTHTVKLLLVRLPKGRGQKACSTTGRGTEEGTLGTYPGLWYRKALAKPGAKSRKKGATDRACKSPTLFSDVMTNRKTVLSVRTRSETSSNGSNGGLQRASRTMARSHGGTQDRTGGLSLSAPQRKRVTRGCLPKD